jgi:hypothetical protein
MFDTRVGDVTGRIDGENTRGGKLGGELLDVIDRVTEDASLSSSIFITVGDDSRALPFPKKRTEGPALELGEVILVS